MIVDSRHKPCNIPLPVWADDKLFTWVVTEEKAHDAVPSIMLAAIHVIDFPCIFCNYCHVLYVPVRLHNKSAKVKCHIRSLETCNTI